MINQNRLINTFCTLVQIDSPTGSEVNITNFLVEFLQNNKLVDHVQKDSFGNVYAKKSGTGNEEIFFTDHVDTVEPGRGIEPRIEGDYITSSSETILGADDKSSVAALLEMLFVLKEQKISHKPLEFIFTISEEVGNLGAINFEYSLLSAKKGYCFDCSWPLGTLVTASPFYERFDMVLKGKSAHASRPELATNVLPALAEIVMATKLGILDEETIFNIGVLEGGSVRNAIPGDIKLEGEIRSFSEPKLKKYKTDFLNNLKAIGKRKGIQITTDFVRENPGFKLTGNQIDRIKKDLNQKLEKTGYMVKATQLWSVSDTNIFIGRGLNCINLGSGREFAHTTRERISIKNLTDLTLIMLELSKI